MKKLEKLVDNLNKAINDLKSNGYLVFDEEYGTEWYLDEAHYDSNSDNIYMLVKNYDDYPEKEILDTSKEFGWSYKVSKKLIGGLHERISKGKSKQEFRNH